MSVCEVAQSSASDSVFGGKFSWNRTRFGINSYFLLTGTRRALHGAEAKLSPSTFLRSPTMFTRFAYALAFSLCATSLVLAEEKSAADPTCCMKRAYCCSVKASCCGKTLDAEVIPVAFNASEAAKPICCDKRTYCCTVKAPCCGKTLMIEVADITKEAPAAAVSAGNPADPTCCMKRAYCCTMKATCCGKESKVDLVAKVDDKEFVKASTADPTCCMKRAYCCSIKSPCCNKTVEIELVR